MSVQLLSLVALNNTGMDLLIHQNQTVNECDINELEVHSIM